MNKVLIIGTGSCIVEAIIRHFQAVPGLSDKADLYLSQILPNGRAPVSPDLLGRCNILIEEAAPWQNKGTLSAEEKAQLSPDCVTVSVPTLHFNSLWPLMAMDPRNVPEPDAPYGRIPFPVGDRLALRIIESVPDPSERRPAYDAIDFAKTVNLARSHELEIRNCFAREQGCDVRVAAYVMSHFRDKRLYYTHNHPTGELMYFVMAQLFAVPVIRDLVKLPYDQLVTAARHWADTGNVFAGEEAPIHPAVADHFQLKWWRRDHKYPLYNVARTFDEWIDWYLAYTPDAAQAAPTNNPVVAAREESLLQVPESGEVISVGPFLAVPDVRQQLRFGDVLCDERDVERTPFFFATAVDATISQHGDILHCQAMRTYRSPEAICGVLADATMIGTDGLVVHRGQVIGDTVRHLTVGENAPAIAAIFPDRLVLKPTLSREATVWDGAYFCGFSGGWQNYTIWLAATLPRLIAYKQLREQRPDVRLVLPRFTGGSFQNETLSLLGIEPTEIMEIGDHSKLKFAELFVTSAFDLWAMSPYGREAAHQLAAAALAGRMPPRDAPERLYVYSALSRETMINFDRVVTLLSQYGFRCMSLDDLSLREQIAIMQRARFVVGDHGPALANLLFAQRGTRALELFRPRDPQPLYWSVASISGQDYGFVVGHSASAADNARHGSAELFEMPIPVLQEAIQALLSGPG